nr:MAG TPA: hypothetical protein [Bacteriophage sp.]
MKNVIFDYQNHLKNVMMHQFFTEKIVCPKYYIVFRTYLHEKAG